MITLKNKIKNFTIPNSYADLTVEDYEFIKDNENDQVAIAMRLTGLDIGQVALIEWDSIRPYLEFLQVSPLESAEPINILELGEKIYTLPDDIRTCWFAQKLSAFAHLLDNDLLTAMCVYLQPLVFGPDFEPDDLEKTKALLQASDMDAVYSCVAFIVDQLKEIAEIEKKLDLKPTPEQIEAGVKNFNVLGDFNVIDQLANGDPLKYDKILRMDYNTIYNKLLKNNITAKYDRAYSKIINRPKGGKG